jgi:adenylosuccinate lyase
MANCEALAVQEESTIAALICLRPRRCSATILPIDSGRYGSAEMRQIFDEENRLQCMLNVEAALARAQARVGDIPEKDAATIAKKASIRNVRLERVKQIEARTKHETAAIVEALSEACGKSGQYVHMGATSSDILDTATALQAKDALELILKRVDQLEHTLLTLVEKYSDIVCVGRTHGQHALPMTLGLKFAVWMREISRHISRLRECAPRVVVGKLAGAVGTMAGLGDHALEIQRLVMENLRLGTPEVTTQIVQRDRYAELVCTLANLASSIDKFSTEIRNLQRTEIDEAREPFDIKYQVGSSAIPHKMNPKISENISSVAKIVRSLVQPSLESVVTWHERDLTQSAAERFTIPEAFILTEHMLASINKVLLGLWVSPDRMTRNLNLTGGMELSEALVSALVRKGMQKPRAFKLVRAISIESTTRHRPFQDLVQENTEVTKLLSRNELEPVFDPRNYLGKTKELIRLATEKTRQERRSRGLTA